MNNIVLEACVDSLERAITAERSGAHRLELCTNLHLDGTTPGLGLVQSVMKAVTIPVKVMIRPRGGDFVYTPEEFNAMLDDIRAYKDLGIRGIVTGVLNTDNTPDLARIGVLSKAAVPVPVTIHKCIDLVPDIDTAIAQLKQIPGVRSILSSGQAATALEGAVKLKKMLLSCGDQLRLIVAGKVTQKNLRELIDITGAKEFHGRNILKRE